MYSSGHYQAVHTESSQKRRTPGVFPKFKRKRKNGRDWSSELGGDPEVQTDQGITIMLCARDTPNWHFNIFLYRYDAPPCCTSSKMVLSEPFCLSRMVRAISLSISTSLPFQSLRWSIVSARAAGTPSSPS
jgi:hypothetical protein